MSTSADTVESLLFRSGAVFDQLDPTTWILHLENRHNSRVWLRKKMERHGLLPGSNGE
ncbi:MAG: hypothetical protein ACYTDX_11285 [Planctomycetota bacterium]